MSKGDAVQWYGDKAIYLRVAKYDQVVIRLSNGKCKCVPMSEVKEA